VHRFAALSLAESLTRLQAAGVPRAPALAGQSEVFLNDPHAAANDLVATHQHPVMGQMWVPRHYVRFGNTAVVQGRPTPLLGEHTREVLHGVGFTEQAIAEIYAKGMIKTEAPVTEC
jgi:crotonobetainyl-CoA:carnitine CoA-transferase CaiB-like acyl-CoA transferase